MNRHGDFPPGGDGMDAKLAVSGCGEAFAVKKRQVSDLVVS